MPTPRPQYRRATGEDESDDPFRDYHRERRRATTARLSVGLGAVASVIAAGIWLATLSPTSAVAVASTPAPAPKSTAIATMTSSGGTPVTSATPTPQPSATSSSTPAVSKPPHDVHISITATGYQHELDECQWVRMDLGAEAPIVGAHTQCGGAVVLTLHAGERVDLTGQGLDGKYVVTDSRDAHSGDNAATALAGMDATVVLQTCYPGTGGHERLVGLEPA